MPTTRRSCLRSPTWPRRTERSILPDPGIAPKADPGVASPLIKKPRTTDAMATLTRPRPRRSFPIRLLAVVGAMLLVVVVSQVASHLRTSAPPQRQAPVVVDPLQPGIGDLDAGAISGSSGSGSGTDAGPAAGAGAAADPGVSDIARIKADIEFWSSRVARDRDDFISSNRWGISEIELARATGDLSAFLRANAAFDTTLAPDQHNAAAPGYKGSVLVSPHPFVDPPGL